MRQPKLFLVFFVFFFVVVASPAAQDAKEALAQKHYEAAQAAEKKGDYDQAGAEYREILKLYPQLPEVYNNLGLVYYVQGKNADAIAAFEQVLAAKPDALGANLFLGMAYLRTNQYEKSLQPLQKAIDLNPKDTRPYLNLSVSYSELGRDVEAARVLEKAAELSRTIRKCSINSAGFTRG